MSAFCLSELPVRVPSGAKEGTGVETDTGARTEAGFPGKGRSQAGG